MKDIALDANTGDLILSGPSRKASVVAMDGAARIAQAVTIRLRCWLGEWFLDTSHGVPYLEKVLGKQPNPNLVSAILKSQILSVNGVRSLTSFSLSIDNTTRVATVAFQADTTEGNAAGVVRF